MIVFRLIGESFRFAADALRQNKTRTILSLLGITIGISVGIGMISGFWPAYAASKMDPVEAIRS